MLLGKGTDGLERGVIVELKQWEKAGKSTIEDCVTLAGSHDVKLHPSRQAGQYAEDFPKGRAAASPPLVYRMHLTGCTLIVRQKAGKASKWPENRGSHTPLHRW
jgi:hypothetical protein